MNRQDRRARKTDAALQNALAFLLNEKELRHITVQEIVDRADVHRATFYKHYQDVYDLYDKLEQTIVEELQAIMVNMPSHNYNAIYQTIVEYVMENPVPCRLFLGKAGDKKFLARIAEVLEGCYLRIWQYEDRGASITDNIRFLTAYHIGGCLTMIGMWLDTGFIWPKEKIIALLRSVDINIDAIETK